MRFGNGGDLSGIEDRRGRGGGTGLAVGGGGLGVVGLVIWLITSLVGGGSSGPYGDVNSGLNQFPDSAQAPQQGQGVPRAAQTTETRFVAAVVKDVQDSWTQIFAEAGRTYQPTKLVLFTRATSTACGAASSATGPFYCPGDRKVYLDLGFFNELRTRFGAPGDFAQAYVIAHEFGHHVQTLLGIEPQVRQAQQREPELRN